MNEQVFNKNYDAVRMFLTRLGMKALHKKVHPHLFRHSSATYYAPKLNRQELAARMRESIDSAYVDASHVNIENIAKQYKSFFERVLNE